MWRRKLVQPSTNLHLTIFKYDVNNICTIETRQPLYLNWKKMQNLTQYKHELSVFLCHSFISISFQQIWLILKHSQHPYEHQTGFTCSEHWSCWYWIQIYCSDLKDPQPLDLWISSNIHRSSWFKHLTLSFNSHRKPAHMKSNCHQPSSAEKINF